MAKDYSKKMKQSALIQQTEEYMDNEVFAEQPAHPTTDAPVPEALASGILHPISQQIAVPEPTPYNEVLKNVGAKIPYSIYDRLERIKRMSERSGNKADKRNIGDLIAQAIKEFVEKYDVVQ